MEGPVNYHPDIVLMMFRKEKPSTQITLEKVEKYDADLAEANDEALVAACEAAGVEPSKFNRSRVLGLALLSLGSTGKVGTAAKDYRKALDAGVIG
jgi:hypothetical protein